MKVCICIHAYVCGSAYSAHLGKALKTKPKQKHNAKETRHRIARRKTGK